ncbi:hypothetical protein VB779_22965 [Haloarculaceae archaeon H-GB11]|nr:hypothetical protein [Haloarculaceae archaeon H-GB11]
MIEGLQEAGRSFVGYDDEMESGDVLLRHDVDWSPANAERMAQLEADRGVSSTYFFLLTSPFYNLSYEANREAVSTILELGHDIGLHFSTHQYWSAEPDREELESAVQTERTVLSTLFDEEISTVSFHIPPEWVLRRSFDPFQSTYEERYFSDIAYRGDSNQRWRSDPPFADGIPEKVQILAHPGLWNDTDQLFEERLDAERRNHFADVSSFLEYQFVDDAVAR